MGTWGGKQPGAGRPKGSLSSKTQELIARMSEDGITPVEVFLNDMRYFYNLGEQKMRLAEQEEDGKKQAKTFRVACTLKEMARDCARDAAPYMHPKLANIQGKVEVSNVEAKLSELE